MFNALKCAKHLVDAGVPREQAEAHVQLICEVMEMNLATKQDILLLEQRMTIRLGTIVSLAIGIAVALAKLVS